MNYNDQAICPLLCVSLAENVTNALSYQHSDPMGQQHLTVKLDAGHTYSKNLSVFVFTPNPHVVFNYKGNQPPAPKLHVTFYA